MAILMVGFLASWSTTRLYRWRVPRLTYDNFMCCHTRDSGETMTSVSDGHIILTPTQPVGGGGGGVAIRGIKPRTSLPGVARSTDWATAPLQSLCWFGDLIACPIVLFYLEPMQQHRWKKLVVWCSWQSCLARWTSDWFWRDQLWWLNITIEMTEDLFSGVEAMNLRR